jgi:hypothetical protein
MGGKQRRPIGAPPLMILEQSERCIFGCKNAIGLYFLPAGCFCFPDDQFQCLCWQHLAKATAIDGLFEFIYWGA